MSPYTGPLRIISYTSCVGHGNSITVIPYQGKLILVQEYYYFPANYAS